MAMTLESLRGRTGDVDSHEMIPVPRFPEFFGEVGARFVTENQEFFDNLNKMPEGHPHRITVAVKDDEVINEQTVWEKKGIWAPSHADFDRRPAVLDAMGIQRQLVFPGFGLIAFIQMLGGGANGYTPSTPEQRALGRLAIDAHNRWAGEVTRKFPSRLRIVGMLSTGDPGLTPETLTKKTEEVIALGVRAIQIPSSQPPAGLSPADPKLDPWYATLAKASVALVFHPPSGFGFRKSDVWESAVPRELHHLAILHQAEENFCCALVLGGVFERHPTLRVGFIETGAAFIGPLAERLDMGGVGGKPPATLSMKPSEYLIRNVRVGLLASEPIDLWLNRWPGLQDVYCYSSDYPHVEGQPYSLRTAFERVAPLGDAIVEKYFVKNSELLLPIAA